MEPVSRKRRREDSEGNGVAVPKRPSPSRQVSREDEQYRKSMYLAYVRDTLRKKSQGKTAAYEELVARFTSKSVLSDATSSQEIRLMMTALSHVVSQLDRNHAALVDAVLSMPWTTADATFVKSYIAFVGMLVSARPEYLSAILVKSVDGLTYQSGLRALNQNFAEGSTHPLTRREVYERQHNLLMNLLTLIPTLPNTLQPILVRKFPHKRQEKISQVTYIRNLLRLTEYCPELSDKILATIVDRAIQVDVEIQVELEDLEQDEGELGAELVDADPFDSVIGDELDGAEEDGDLDDVGDNLSDLSSEGGDLDDDSVPNQMERNVAHIQDMVTKLDAILKLVFDHFQRTHTSSYRPPSPLTEDILLNTGRTTPPFSFAQAQSVRRSQFKTLLFIFDRTILRTFKSRYTQFLVFWYSSLDPEFSEDFLGMLLEKSLFEPDLPSITRASAASYVGSYVSRAQFVDADSARRVVGILCESLAVALDRFAESEGPTDIAHYTVFYAVTQALFLIFCFRWRDLQVEHIDEELDADLGFDVGPSAVSEKKWLPQLDVVQRVITSALNPLKVCSTNVVKQFAKVAQTTGFAYCYSILESNRRSEHNPADSPSSSTGMQQAINAKNGQQTLRAHAAQLKANPLVIRDSTVDADLNSFFPFDPYRLPLSHSYIEGVYREWQSVALDDDEDSDSESDGDDDQEQDPNDEQDEDDDPTAGGRRTPHGLSFGSPMIINSLHNDSADDLGKSFGGMSISPMHHHIGSFVSLQA